MTSIQGIIAATYTPFDSQGELNLSLIPRYAAHLKATGVQGVFVNGTTGEGVSLTTEERKHTAEAWMTHQSEDFRVLIHVGHNALPTARELAAHAREIGADGVGAMATTFFACETMYQLVAVNAEIAKAAPELPYFYYHIPFMTGAKGRMIDFLRQAPDRIPNLAGLKFTHEDFMDMKQCVEFAEGRYTILHGRDEILLYALQLGVDGAIGSTYNYLTPLYRKIMAAFEAGKLDQADQLQQRAVDLVEALVQFGGGVTAGKALMQILGLDLGPTRLPLQPLSAEKRVAFAGLVEKMGLKEVMPEVR